MGKIDLQENQTRKGLAAIYGQEIIQDVALFTSRSAASFYDKLFASLDFTPAQSGDQAAKLPLWSARLLL